MSDKPADYDPGSLTTLSPSRIKVADQCTQAFDFQYVRRIPRATENAAAMFGNVIHDGLHVWYGDDDREGRSSTRHRELSLIEIVRNQWTLKLPPKITSLLLEVIVANQHTEAVAQAILLGRPDLKAVRQTKAFLESREWRDEVFARNVLIDACHQVPDIKWPKDEDPFKAYLKSLDIAEQMERRWKHQPRPFAVERAFTLRLGSFELRGRIDMLRGDINASGELLGVDMMDVKTSRDPLTQMEAFIQAWMYDEAVAADETIPDADSIVFFLARQNRGQRGSIDRRRHRALALRILGRVKRSIENRDYAPHYGHWCRRCDFKDLCEKEIGMWLPGTEGFVLEAA